MNTKQLKVAALFMALVLGIISSAQRVIHAQDKAAPSSLSTNWVGGLVVGRRETGDPIAGRGLFPQVESDLELGLRSDGVVVWRKAQP